MHERILELNIGDVIDTIGNITDTVEEMFDDMGKYCVDWTNSALSAYQNLTSSASSILQTDVDSGIFKSFWKVINQVSSVFCIIASSLILLFFVMNIASETWETRHELDMWSLIKDIIKLIVSVVVVNNALFFVKTIFNIGAKLAMVITLSTNIKKLNVTDKDAVYISDGVSGIRGLFIFIVFMIAALVLVICGVIITLEIYKRVFKIYILIPLASLSFSTFAISAHQNGSEVFSGYIKNIIQTALEGIIIMIILFFSYTMINSNKLMSVLFPTFNQFDVIETTAHNESELAAITMFIEEYAENDSVRKKYTFSEYFTSICKRLEEGELMLNSYANIDIKKEDVSEGLLKLLDESDVTKINKIDGNYDVHQFDIGSNIGFHDAIDKISGKKQPKVSITIYPKCSTLDAFMILLQIVFPIALCAGAVKEAGTYSGMILGK